MPTLSDKVIDTDSAHQHSLPILPLSAKEVSCDQKLFCSIVKGTLFRYIDILFQDSTKDTEIMGNTPLQTYDTCDSVVVSIAIIFTAFTSSYPFLPRLLNNLNS